MRLKPTLDKNEAFEEQLKETLKANKVDKFVDEIVEFAITSAYEETDRETYQAMEAFIHNLNTMHSRAGAQVPFSSINYGMDTSSEGRMVMRNILLATEAGLGHGETPIFPIQIFRVKEGINYNEGEPNYDLFKLACRTSAKRLFPNFHLLMLLSINNIIKERQKLKLLIWDVEHELWEMFMLRTKKLVLGVEI